MKVSNPEYIFLRHPTVLETEERYVLDALKEMNSGKTSKYIDLFENALKNYTQTNYLTTTSSATTALHIALQVLGIERGDSIMCSTFSYIATANPISYLGACPIFIDSHPLTWQINDDLLEESLKKLAKTNRLPKALVIANIFGESGNLDRISQICHYYDIKLIEDAAQSLGSTYNNQSMGSWGDLGVYSFNNNKIVSATGGGALTGKDEKLIKKAKHLISQAKQPGSHFFHDQIGYNYTLSNVLAAIGLGQLEQIALRLEKSQEIYDFYQKKLQSIHNLTFMQTLPGVKSNHWLTPLLLPPEVSPDAIIRWMHESHIEIRKTWTPIHLLPSYKQCAFIGNNTAEMLWNRGICLPSSHSLNLEQLSYITSKLEEGIIRCAQ